MKPFVRDAEPMLRRLISFCGDDPAHPTDEEILALALRNILGMASEQIAVSLHGLELDDPSLHFTLCCATKIEMANRAIRAAEEYLDRLPKEKPPTQEQMDDHELVVEYVDRHHADLGQGLSDDVGDYLRRQHVAAILNSPEALRQVKERAAQQ